MTIQQFETMLRESGIDDATVKGIIANEKIAAKTGSLKQADEYQTLEQRAQTLEASLAKAKTYEDWYGKNYATVQKLQQDFVKYTERYGSLDEPNPAPQPASFTKDDVKRMVQEQAEQLFKSTYAPQVVALTTGIGGVVEKHMRRGRKDKIDWKKLDELAATTNGDIDKAYEDWDAPNVAKDNEDAFNKRVEAAVKERVAAAGVNANFPAAAESASSHSPLSSYASGPKQYDRNELLKTLYETRAAGGTQ